MKQITGKTLLKLGYKSSSWFKEAIAYINTNRLSEEQIREYCDRFVMDTIEPHMNPTPYHLNIEGISYDEKANIKAVTTSMNEVMRTPVVVKGTIMPDACPAGPKGTIPVGGVVVTKNAIVPNFHSADICCSVMLSTIDASPKEVMNMAMEVTHFGWGSNPLFVNQLPDSLLKKIRSNKYTRDLEKFAMGAIGTQGDGNHFLYVGTSKETRNTTLVTHHGSRSFGARLFKKGKEVAERMTKQISPNSNKMNSWIPFDTEEGQDYWEALQIVREWTKLNHLLIHNKIAVNLNAHTKANYWNEHNFVFKRDDLFYHAKGATPMTDDFVPDNSHGLRIIPLNMAEPILIVKDGGGTEGLGFAPHGAGRNMSRSEHLRRNTGDLNEIMERETKGLDIRSFSGVLDISELPSAYKSAEDVKRQIIDFELGVLVDEIIPYGSIMAGKVEEFWRKKKK